MKYIKNLIYFGLLAICSLCVTSCNDDVTYDFPGDPYNRVYLQDNSSAFKIVQTPISTVSNLDFQTIVKCTKIASEDIKVTIEIDNSVIDIYNELHETNYEAFPESALILENTTLNIIAGSMESSDTLKIKITDNESVISNLNSSDGYLIPLRLTKTEGDNSQISTNIYFTDLVVTVTEDNINHDASESDITGILVEDQSGWTASTNGNVSRQPISALFDGNLASYCSISIRNDLTLDIDMGQEYTFDAITLYYGFSWGSNVYEYASLTRNMNIFTSEDGETWQSIGVISASSSKYCVFYAPITTRYIRILKPYTGSNNSISAGIFNVYAK